MAEQKAPGITVELIDGSRRTFPTAASWTTTAWPDGTGQCISIEVSWSIAPELLRVGSAPRRATMSIAAFPLAMVKCVYLANFAPTTAGVPAALPPPENGSGAIVP